MHEKGLKDSLLFPAEETVVNANSRYIYNIAPNSKDTLRWTLLDLVI